MVDIEDIHPGDVLTWRGVNKWHRADVIMREDGTLLAKMTEDYAFRVVDLIGSMSLRVCKNLRVIDGDTLKYIDTTIE